MPYKTLRTSERTSPKQNAVFLLRVALANARHYLLELETIL